MNQVDVSIVVPVYNAERYLRLSIDSLINQTHRNIEIICVDDGSRDSSFEILSEYQLKDNRIKVFKNEVCSEGAAEARNVGLRNASGEYVAFLDADDFADEDMLEKALLSAKATDADILMFDAWYYDDEVETDFTSAWPLNRNYLPKKDVFAPIEFKDNVFRMTHGAVWGRLFKKSFIQSHKLEFFSCYYWDDIEFFYVAFCLANRVGILKERLMHYRYNADGNQTATFRRHPEIAYKATIEIRRRFEYYGIYEAYRVPLLNMLTERAFSILNRLDKVEEYSFLFYQLKNGKLRELGAYDLEDEEYVVKKNLCYRNLIESSNSPLEFLLSIRGQNLGRGEKGKALLSKITGGCSKIYIYGAGVQGRRMFNIIFNDSMYTVVGWCDQNYEEIGYPVTSPNEVTKTSFDYIVIAIEDCNIAAKVKEFLVSNGVPLNKILWMNDFKVQ